MLKRSATSMSRAFDAYDDSGEKVLSFDQFRAFLKANPDVLSLSTALLQDKLKNAELLKPMEDAVNRIKQERTERKGREREGMVGGPLGDLYFSEPCRCIR